jgi:colanic acid biosynthesis protein WcaH
LNVKEAIATLHASIPEAQDLPQDIFRFVTTITPMVNVDLLVKDEQGRTLLTWRDDEHYGAGWHVPGGIIRFKEHALERVRKVAEHELGCQVEAESMPMLVSEAISESRERGHFISFLYRCKISGQPAPELKANDVPQRGHWRWFQKAPRDLLPAHRVYEQFL